MPIHRRNGDFTEFPHLNEQLYQGFASEAVHSNASVASSDMTGDGTSSYCSRDDYTDIGCPAIPNGYMPSQGAIYSGCHSPVLNTHRYLPYQMDGIRYYNNQIVDYTYGNEPLYGTLPAGVQYPAHQNEGFYYGPQFYEYQLQPYYHQPPPGQCMSASLGMSAGGVVIMEPQDPTVLLPNGPVNYVTPVAAGPSIAFIPSISCGNPALPVGVSTSSLAVSHSSQPLRASAPAWINPTRELKADFKQHEMVATSSELQPPRINGMHPNKLSFPAATNKVLNRRSTFIPPITASDNAHFGTAPLLTHSISSMKGPQAVGEKGLKKNVSLSAVVSGGVQTKSHQVMRPVAAVYNKGSCLSLPDGQRCNPEDFVTKYNEAKHFIIKSYSEENVLKSIQHGVWASTPNGNKKLDDAYHDAQQRAGGKLHGCPIFLYFSVNGSRQFCGVAEMIGPVDYNRSMEFWEQHKWSGSFPVKWHFIKDVPNSQFRRIILQNNENKVVTNSRDTQEVFFQQGLEMLIIIKNYPARTSILDDFSHCNSFVKASTDQEAQQLVQVQSFPTKCESDLKAKSEEHGVKCTNVVSTALKVCENSVKVSNLARPNNGKVSPAVLQDTNLVKDGRRVDKENIKVAAKDRAFAGV
ncbi:hypothetical protein KP509_02G102000 [Ceratopteris richardii]|nr:hypothetical protein KP509_02G102000 [Ceratopteris richardii]KAH7445010.1 hypothetical protein KP509_02G102000 [Ceratopteris richardii]